VLRPIHRVPRERGKLAPSFKPSVPDRPRIRSWVRRTNGWGGDPGSARPGLDLRSSPCTPAGDARREV
jgi:hypothetical protein